MYQHKNKKYIAHYNLFEKSFARILARIPKIKKVVKQIYQYIMLIFYKKPYKNNTLNTIRIIDSTGCNETFFGYYDKSPVSPDGDYIIYNSSLFPTYNKPNPNVQYIEIIIQKILTGTILVRIPSLAYNWQQGCRVQWLNNDLIIYNDFDILRKQYIARVFSVSLLKEVKTFNYPVQDSYKTEYFLSLNYQRLITLRPDYGYRNLPVLNKTSLADKDNDGIWMIDYETGNSKLLVSLSAMSAIAPNKNMDIALHKVNHIMISPSGKQFIFLHRYYIGQRRFDRLMVADSTTGNVKILADYEMVSHCFWLDDKTILGYLRGPDKKDAYWLIDINTGNFTSVADKRLNQYGDGHPHVHGDWFITDTYPDKARMQHLILVNWKTGEIQEVGEFFHGFKYSGEARCDLHPRFSPDGRSVFFDSIFSGKRQLYRMDISL